MNLQGGSDSESESDDESDLESDDESDDEEDLATTAPQTLHHKRGIVLPETKSADGKGVRLEEVATVGVRDGTTLMVTAFEERVSLDSISHRSIVIMRSG